MAIAAARGGIAMDAVAATGLMAGTRAAEIGRHAARAVVRAVLAN
jgi:hypothetical protein